MTETETRFSATATQTRGRIDIPTLETERLLMRAPRDSDVAAHASFYSGPRSAMVGGPLTAELAWRALASEAGHWLLRGYGRWIVADKHSDEALGIVGLWFPRGWPEPELGWTLFDAAEGRGVAYEAALAARDFAFSRAGWSTIISLIDPNNTRSRALATRLGAHVEAAFEHERYGHMEIWRHPGPRGAAFDHSTLGTSAGEARP